MKILYSIIAAVVCVVVSSSAFAKMQPKIEAAVMAAYPPAEPHRGLDTAYVPVQDSLMKGYVVVEKGGILAERARFFISWDDYDYRGVVIHLDKGGEITTRRGAPYTYLKRGDVMAVAGVEYFHNTIYLKLISAGIYVPDDRQTEEHHSRVTVMVGFKFPKEVTKNDDAGEVMRQISSWLVPFPNRTEAAAYSGRTLPQAPAVVKDKIVIQEKGAASGPLPATEADRIKNLEQKINDAKRQMDEAEKEMKRLKGDRTGK